MYTAITHFHERKKKVLQIMKKQDNDQNLVGSSTLRKYHFSIKREEAIVKESQGKKYSRQKKKKKSVLKVLIWGGTQVCSRNRRRKPRLFGPSLSMGTMVRNHVGRQRKVRTVSPCYGNLIHSKSNRKAPKVLSMSITLFDFHLMILLLLLCGVDNRGQKGKQVDQL